MAIENFVYKNPVKIIFGQNQIPQLSKNIAKDKKVLILYGGSSAKKFGTIDKVKDALSGYIIGEFDGIPANPTYEKCMEAVKLIKSENYDYLLAVGGGSVIDATKFISIAVFVENPQDFFYWGDNKPIRAEKALPFGTVLTIPATGSEMNNGGVITFIEKKAKYSFASKLTYPEFSILDPTLTYTLPKKQLANGIVDTYVHVIEQYLTYPVDAKIQDYFAERVLKTLIDIAPDVMDESKSQDYATRANFMWASTNGLNGYIACGVPEDWATHLLGHELTERFNIDHGRTLAIVLPSLMNIMRDVKKDKILQYGKNIFGIADGSDEEKIDKAIQKTREFFESLEVSTHLADYNVTEKDTEEIVDRLVQRGRTAFGENNVVTVEKMRMIYKGAM
jgi:alcohol dehydrogenase yqhD